ncbi:hypothetical protein BDV95DRAFT_648932 [Massariosphaeria phaeospora]|uniref:Uncharacterized protein n=1 Tax=Massariosphaeria phaeospora TaxID=100035 RepID=A0A7C8I467_9PLEO|nr:hypothetical protein BDV95DRAFT_648932 [Massariosphaeria phaeospora]
MSAKRSPSVDFETKPSKNVKLTDPLHPHEILTHLVKNVILQRFGENAVIMERYRALVDDAEGTIAKCTSMVEPWLVSLYEQGKLYGDNAYQQAVTQFEDEAGQYVHLFWGASGRKAYSGQTDNLSRRIPKEHDNQRYRNKNRTLHYLYYEELTEGVYLVPCRKPKDQVPGPIDNIMEQWISLVFRTMQPEDLKANFSKDALELLAPEDLDRGTNIREPLAQGFTFYQFPMRSLKYFRHSSDPVKRKYADIHHNSVKIEKNKRQDYLTGNHQPRFCNENRYSKGTDYAFVLHGIQLRVGRSFVDRFEPTSIRLQCFLAPEGHTHPNGSINASIFQDDPCHRLAIKITGLYKTVDVADRNGFVWVRTHGQGMAEKLNRLVDFLEGYDLKELRPRR